MLWLQWLQSIVHLHAEINKFLSSAATSKSTLTVQPTLIKPMASVVPQIHLNSIAADVLTEPTLMSEVPSAMEIETGQVETAALDDTLQDRLSKEQPDSDKCDVECVGINACESEYRSRCRDAECQGSERLDLCDVECRPDVKPCVADACETTCQTHNAHISDVEPSSLPAMADHCCHVNTVWGNELSSLGNCRLAGCCDDVIASARCSDYEAASVLSGLLQLAAVAAPSTSLNTVETTAPGTSLSVVQTTEHADNGGSVDCATAVQPLSASSSPFCSVSTQPVTSGLSACPCVCLSVCLSVCSSLWLYCSMCC